MEEPDLTVTEFYKVLPRLECCGVMLKNGGTSVEQIDYS